MTKEIIDTTNKLIKPGDIPSSENDVIKQLSDNLQGITLEEVDVMCDEMDVAKWNKKIFEEMKRQEKERKERKEREEKEEKENVNRILWWYREIWCNRIEGVDNVTKNKIIESAQRIPIKIVEKNNWDRITEIKLWWKIYKILYPKLDEGYKYVQKYSYDKWYEWNYIDVYRINSKNIDLRESNGVKKYVKEQINKGFHIPTKEDIEMLLWELWRFADIGSEINQIAMLMYYIWINWSYLLDSRWYIGSRYVRDELKCHSSQYLRCFSNASILESLLMISVCEDPDAEIKKTEVENIENNWMTEKNGTEDKKEDNEKIEELWWDTTDAILNDLKENHVRIEENVEMLWYKWKIVHIDLPAVWNFEWFKFDYFVSDTRVTKKLFEKKKLFERESKLEKKSYSMKDISQLLQAVNKYMAELKWNNDGSMDYEQELMYWSKNRKEQCKAWYYLSAITWLTSFYWLSDKDIDWKKNSHAFWCCDWDNCYFYRCDNEGFIANLEAHVFLRLSN